MMSLPLQHSASQCFSIILHPWLPSIIHTFLSWAIGAQSRPYLFSSYLLIPFYTCPYLSAVIMINSKHTASIPFFYSFPPLCVSILHLLLSSMDLDFVIGTSSVITSAFFFLCARHRIFAVGSFCCRFPFTPLVAPRISDGLTSPQPGAVTYNSCMYRLQVCPFILPLPASFFATQHSNMISCCCSL